jgi:hypothetical protein
MIYQFYLRLRGFEPPIWRRLHVADCRIDDLFGALHIALGFPELFGVGSVAQVGTDASGHRTPEPTQYTTGDQPLSRLAPPGCKLGRWESLIGHWRFYALFEGCLPAIPGTHYPRCTEGQRAGIPRDGMEPKEYRRFLRALANPNDAEHEAAMMRGRWKDPEEFDPDAVNATLQERFPAATAAVPDDSEPW